MSDDTDPRQANEGQAKPANADTQSAAADPAAQAGAELEALIAENADMRDRLLRTMADMENLRRRTEREKTDTSRYAISNFARDVLTVGDNLRRTIEHVPTEAASQDPALKSFLDGVELTERELLNVLERYGVVRIEPLGARFDPNCHQAMYEVQNPDVPEGTVVDVMQAGYVIGDRCLRPALVAIAKGGAKAGAAGPGGEGPGKPANDDFPRGGAPRGGPSSKDTGGKA
jgi:molecular chaperone GrpE